MDKFKPIIGGIYLNPQNEYVVLINDNVNGDPEYYQIVEFIEDVDAELLRKAEDLNLLPPRGYSSICKSGCEWYFSNGYCGNIKYILRSLLILSKIYHISN